MTVTCALYRAWLSLDGNRIITHETQMDLLLQPVAMQLLELVRCDCHGQQHSKVKIKTSMAMLQ
jgi:hypothetical protein